MGKMDFRRRKVDEGPRQISKTGVMFGTCFTSFIRDINPSPLYFRVINEELVANLGAHANDIPPVMWDTKVEECLILPLLKGIVLEWTYNVTQMQTMQNHHCYRNRKYMYAMPGQSF